jgi:uncharacterized membrane protein YvlD (DUF360 family)
MLQLVSSLVQGFKVSGFWTAFFARRIISIKLLNRSIYIQWKQTVARITTQYLGLYLTVDLRK